MEKYFLVRARMPHRGLLGRDDLEPHLVLVHMTPSNARWILRQMHRAKTMSMETSLKSISYIILTSCHAFAVRDSEVDILTIRDGAEWSDGVSFMVSHRPPVPYRHFWLCGTVNVSPGQVSWTAKFGDYGYESSGIHKEQIQVVAALDNEKDEAAP